jgi:hypothetical protein
MPFEAFLTLNFSVLTLNSASIRGDAVTLDTRALPRQYGDTATTARPASTAPAGGSSHTTPRKRAFSQTGSAPSPSSRQSGPPSGSSSQSSGTSPTKVKFLCVADQSHQYDATNFPACPRGSACTLLHAPKPSNGKITPVARAELLASVAAIKNLPGQKRTKLTALFNSLPSF